MRLRSRAPRRENTIFVHVTLVPWIAAAQELKTKPTQHSVKELRAIGIQPDILLCRSEMTASLLRQEAWARNKRILTWSGEPTPAVQHAFVQAFAEEVTAPVIVPRRVLPQIDDAFRGRGAFPRG